MLVGFLPEIFASLIWYSAHTASEGRLSERLESSILVAEGLFAAAHVCISIITLSVLVVLYGVIYRFEQERWTRISKFWYWLLVSLLGLLFCLFAVLFGLRQALNEQIQQAMFVAFVDRLSEQSEISSLTALVLLAAIPFYISIIALGVGAYRLSRGKNN
jgi:ABC-type arginine transport system permease subunit